MPLTTNDPNGLLLLLGGAVQNTADGGDVGMADVRSTAAADGNLSIMNCWSQKSRLATKRPRPTSSLYSEYRPLLGMRHVKMVAGSGRQKWSPC